MMIDPITQYILLEIKQREFLYHAASELTKTLVPRKSTIGAVAGVGKKEWNKKAIFAAMEKDQAYPFGLERINMMFPYKYTEEEVNAFDKACFLSVNKQKHRLEIWYYNHTPKEPLYLYYVNRNDFKQILGDEKNPVKQWYSTKGVVPIKVYKIYPHQIKDSWRQVGKKEWDIKKQKYRDKGFYKTS